MADLLLKFQELSHTSVWVLEKSMDTLQKPPNSNVWNGFLVAEIGACKACSLMVAHWLALLLSSAGVLGLNPTMGNLCKEFVCSPQV